MLLSEHLLLHTFGSDLAVRTSSSENLLRSTLHIVAKTMMRHFKTVLKMIKLDSLESLINPEKLYIREYTSGNLRKNWSQGYCVQTPFSVLSQLENRRQLCVCVAGEPDIYFLLIKFLWINRAFAFKSLRS